MNLKKILVPVDFSPYSEAALRYAEVLAFDSRALLLIVHVHETRIGEEGFHLFPLDPEGIQRSKQLAKCRPSNPDVAYAQRMAFGDPVEKIVRIAQESRADLIVMGTHGRSGLSRFLTGSVAEGVLRQAPCPVLTMKLPAEESARVPKNSLPMKGNHAVRD